MNLTIFLKNGKILKFGNVTNLKRNKNFRFVITFNYTSEFEGQNQRAIFSTKDVLGLSVNKEDFNVDSLF